MNLEISASYIPHLALFCAKSDVRYYLNGFAAQPHEKDGAYLIASDGHRLIVIHDDTAKIDAPIVVAPSPLMISSAKKAHRARFDGEICTLTDADGELVATTPAKYVCEKWPVDWRAVLQPAKAAPNHEPVGVNLDYIRDLQSLCKSRSLKRYGGAVIHAHDSHRALTLRFPYAENVLVLVMPMRSDTERLSERPEWLHLPALAEGEEPINPLESEVRAA